MKKYILLATALLLSTNAEAATTSRSSSSARSSSVSTSHGMMTGMAIGLAIGHSGRSRNYSGMMIGECPDPNWAVVVECYSSDMGPKGLYAYQGCNSGKEKMTIEKAFMASVSVIPEGKHWEIRSVFDYGNNKWLITGCAVDNEVKE